MGLKVFIISRRYFNLTQITQIERIIYYLSAPINEVAWLTQ